MRITHGTWQPSPYDAPPVQVLTQKELNESICIFPEYITETNVIAPRAVRWWLQKPKQKLKVKGLTYVWSKPMAKYPRLMVDVIDTKLFSPKNRQGAGVAFYVGKGEFDPKQVPEGAVHITRENPPNRESLANLLRAIDHLICFDGYTALATEAAMCGTPVLFVNIPKEIRKLNAEHEFGEDGFAYSLTELEYKRGTVHLVRERYEALKSEFDDDVDYFVGAMASKW